MTAADEARAALAERIEEFKSEYGQEPDPGWQGGYEEGYVARAEWQASRPITAEQVEAAVQAFGSVNSGRIPIYSLVAGIRAALEAARGVQSCAVEVETVEEAEALPSGQWVQDATGQAYCLIDTCLGFPQRMAMQKRSLTNLHNLAYPLHLCDIVGDCEHKWGTHELGQCVRCGQVVAEPRPLYFDADQMAVFRAAGEANDRYNASQESHDANR